MQATGTVSALLDRDLRARTDLDLQVYDALLHTFEAGDDGIRMTDLARQIALSKAGLTALIDRLERRSLVRRVPDPADRRAIRITLTEDGEATFRDAARVHVDGIAEYVTRHLTDEQARVIAEAFEHVRASNTVSD